MIIKPIHSESDYQTALVQIESLWDRSRWQ